MMKDKRKYHLDYFYEKAQKASFAPEAVAKIEESSLAMKEVEECTENIKKIFNEWRKGIEESQKNVYIGLPEYEGITYCFSDMDKGGRIMRLIDALLTFIIDTTDAKKQDLTITLVDLGFSFKEINEVKQAIDDLTFSGPEYRLKKNFDFLYEPYMKVAKYERFVLYLYEQYPNINYVYRKNYPFGYMY